MILLVPVSPEVPRFHRPKIWPSIVMVLALLFSYLKTQSLLQADSKYVEGVESLLSQKAKTQKGLEKNAESYLKLRPLLKISPARGSWDLRRIIYANFIHGSPIHLLLNAVGVFAGIRICTTFLPLLCTFSIFLLGGSLGLTVSLFTTRQFSAYIPHVGASAGIFALMGAYYIYNFRFRTTYFFWLPIRRGFISLRTSWFFFLDVVLLELVLSTAQFFPDRLDSVDHIAHVVGFASGMLIALTLRLVQGWPHFLQTRGEFLYWQRYIRTEKKSAKDRIGQWLELLQINRYNDHLKIKLCSSVYRNCQTLNERQIEDAFRFFVPTFVRLHTDEMAAVLRELLVRGKPIPTRWLARTPYDILIRLAKSLASPAEDQHLLYEFLILYKKAQPGNRTADRKLEGLMAQLDHLKTKKLDADQAKAG